MLEVGEVLERTIEETLVLVGADNLNDLKNIFREDWVEFVKHYPEAAGAILSELITERLQDEEHIEIAATPESAEEQIAMG